MSLPDADFKQMMAQLPKLSPDQRDKTYGKLKALSALDYSGPDRIRAERIKDDSVLDTDFLFDGIMNQMSVRGLVNHNARNSFKRHRAFKVYMAKMPEVVKTLMADKNKIPNTPNARQALGRLGAKCLAELLASWATVSPTLMLVNVDKIPEAIESQFPGYLSNGLIAQLVLRPTGSTFITPRK